VQAGEQLVRVNQDTRLNFRVLDVRTPANQGIFRVQSHVANVFIYFLYLRWSSEDFIYLFILATIGGYFKLLFIEIKIAYW